MNCTLTWDANGDNGIVSGNSKTISQTIPYDTVLGGVSEVVSRAVNYIDITPQFPGHVFLGWFTHPEQGVQVNEYTNFQPLEKKDIQGRTYYSQTYYAHWSINQYKATFLYNDGTEKKMVKVQDFGTALVPPELSRAGYTFNGWSPVVPSTMPARDTTYTAQWLAND